MHLGVYSPIGRMATRLALLPVEPFKHRYPLAALYPHGFTSPDAKICKATLVRGKNVYIGSAVTLFRQSDGGRITLGDNVHLNDGIRIETGSGGSVEIGDGTYVQPSCQFTAYVGSIRVGKNVQIAPRCAFYPYNHGVLRGTSMKAQPLVSQGDIVVSDEAWLGYGVIVLDHVTIGTGAVIGAGSIVKDDVPDFAVAAGVPAKVIKMRAFPDGQNLTKIGG